MTSTYHTPEITTNSIMGGETFEISLPQMTKNVILYLLSKNIF